MTTRSSYGQVFISYLWVIKLHNFCPFDDTLLKWLLLLSPSQTLSPFRLTALNFGIEWNVESVWPRYIVTESGLERYRASLVKFDIGQSFWVRLLEISIVWGFFACCRVRLAQCSTFRLTLLSFPHSHLETFPTKIIVTKALQKRIPRSSAIWTQNLRRTFL